MSTTINLLSASRVNVFFDFEGSPFHRIYHIDKPVSEFIKVHVSFCFCFFFRIATDQSNCKNQSVEFKLLYNKEVNHTAHQRFWRQMAN